MENINDPIQLFVIERGLQTKNGDIATATYKVDIHNKLSSDVILTFAPSVETETSKPRVIKLPLRLMVELLSIPLEMHSVPIEVLLKLAHKIKAEEGVSVIEPVKSKLILPE
jgi:hypothetical protein